MLRKKNNINLQRYFNNTLTNCINTLKFRVMKKTYFQPMTKAMSLNVNAAICSEPVITSPVPENPPTDEAVGAPMF